MKNDYEVIMGSFRSYYILKNGVEMEGLWFKHLNEAREFVTKLQTWDSMK